MDESSLIRELLGFFDKGQISALLVIIAAVLVLTQLLKLTLLRVFHQTSCHPGVRKRLFTGERASSPSHSGWISLKDLRGVEVDTLPPV